MKKLLLMLTLCFATLSMVKAEDLTVAAGTTTSSYLPIYGLYVDTQGTHGQCLYPADSVSDMSGGTISQMKFYMSSAAAAAWTGTIQVSLGETTETALTTATFISDLTPVYTGTLDASSASKELVVEFTTPYTYTGGNLVIDFYVTVAGNYKSCTYLGATGAAGSGHYAYSSTNAITTFLPKVTFEYTAGGAVCGKPSSIEASNITENGATLTWADGSGVYNVEYKKKSDETWTSLLSNTTLQTADLTELLSSTSYDVRVQSYCADLDTVSGWRTSSFRTECGLISIAENGAWFEDFESYDGAAASSSTGGELDACWAVSGTTYTPHVAGSGNYGYYPHSGSKALTCYGGQCYVALPHFADALNGLRINFWARTESASNGTLKLGYITAEDTGDFATFIEIATIPNNTTLKEYEYFLDNLPADADRLVFSWYYSGQYSCGIDDIKVSLLPTCFKPTDIEFSNVTKASAEVAWTANTNETAWVLEYKKSAESAWQAINVTENPYTLENLEAYTQYDVRIAAACSDEDISDYSEEVSFKTAAGIPFVETFDSSLPTDWKRYEQNLDSLYEDPETYKLKTVSTGWLVGNTSGVFPTTANHLYLQIYSTTRKHWIVTPAIELEDNVQLTFDLALTKNSGTLQAVEAGAQDDDKFYVLLTADGGETWEELDYWDNVSSTHPYDQINCSAEGQIIKLDLSGYAGSAVQLAFYGESTVAGGNNYLHIDNVRVDYIPDCAAPMGLMVSNVSSSAATFSWDEAEDGAATWAYGLVANPAEDFVPTDADFVSTTEDLLVTIDTLAENTPYIFILRRACDGANSEYISRRFLTEQVPAALPFADDFENGLNWVLLNGDLTNQWVLGEAAHNGEGTHALYISNDEGATNAYTLTTAGIVYATKTFEFEEPGTYAVTFDWRASGESTWDVLCVALTPEGTQVEAGAVSGQWALPTGWIALHEGTKINLQTTWQSSYYELNLENEGTYKVVMVWRNDGGGGTQPPAAVDNFSIERLLCPTPTELQEVEETATTNSVQVEWTAHGTENQWLIQYKKAAAEDWIYVAEDVTANPFTITGLDASSTYNIRVAAWCDPTDSLSASEFSAPITVVTACAAISSFPFADNFDAITGVTSATTNVLPVCWSYINTTTYSSYKGYPLVYTGSSYANSGSNSLCFYSYNYVSSYSSTNYDPQDQYAILPEMDGISGLRMKFNARAYSASYDADFTVGVMTDPADTATFVAIATMEPAGIAYEPFEVRFNTYEGTGKYIAIKMKAAELTSGSTAYRGIYIDDVVVEELPSCLEADGLQVFDVTATSAKFTWNVEEGEAYVYAYALASEAEPADDAFVAATDSMLISGLNDNAAYVLYLRHNCGGSFSPSISAAFRTKQLPAAVPFADDFENGNGWLFINGTLTNAWAYGEAAHNGEEGHAIYVSNDGGTTNAYTVGSAAVVYAVKSFTFPQGSYVFQYDWKANGEASSTGTIYDYLRVALVPEDAEFAAGTTLPTGVSSTALPAGCIALDGGSALQGATTWQTFTSEEIAIPAGTYKVVLLWRDDTSGGEQTPAAVDNFSISAIACPAVSNIQVANITANSATLSWTPGNEDQEAWEMILTCDPNFDIENITPIAVTNPYAAAELESDTLYYVYVRANCGENEFSAWSSEFSFRTAKGCQLPDGFMLDTLTSSMATISWNTYGQAAFNFAYSTDQTNWIDSLNIASPFTLNNLEAQTTYYFKVQPVCAGEEEWSSVYYFMTECADVTALPWDVDFENMTSSALPLCWDNSASTTSTASGTNPHYVWGVYTYNDNRMLRMYNFYVQSGIALINTPSIVLPEAACELTFDYSNLADCGAFSVKISANGGEWVELQSYANESGTTNYTNPGEFTSETLNLAAYAGQTIKLQFFATANYGSGAIFVDNVSVHIAPSCIKPTGLVISDIKDTTATFTWDAVENGAWDYAILADAALDSIPEESAFATVSNNSLTVDNLAENTAYVFFLRANCGEDGVSDMIAKAFHTTLHPAALPFDEDFEAENSWLLINGDRANAWVIGEAANNGGVAALYISNDGGITNAYTVNATAMVYAAKLLNFDKAGTYTVKYDWKANGEITSGTKYDYLRVALVPASVELTAGTTVPSGFNATALPAGWIAVDEGALNGSTDWAMKEVEVAVEPGLYNIVFGWRNDSSGGQQAPAAVDNIHVQHKAYPTDIEGNAAFENKAVKFIQNDHVYILINGVIYNVTGQKVEVK